jgi:conjugal transfer pilus assembly protein TraK
MPNARKETAVESPDNSLPALDSATTARARPPSSVTGVDTLVEAHPGRWWTLARAATLTAALAALAMGLLASMNARAAQTVEVRDGDTAIARISLRDQTRIRVERGRITDVLGDLYDPAANPTGRLMVVKDEADGEIYVRPTAAPNPASLGPVVASSTTAPIKLDVKSDRGTFALLLQPTDVVGDTLVVRTAGLPAAPAAGASDAATPPQRAAAHVRAVKAMTVAMATTPSDGAPVADLDVRTVAAGGQEVALWREARFVLRQVFRSARMLGEAYELTNISGQRMVIDERELYRPGVWSVAVKRLNLQPGESTPVWVVRAPAANE